MRRVSDHSRAGKFEGAPTPSFLYASEDRRIVGRLLVISGVPATGKSSYCRWVARSGWVHINHDRLTNRAEDQMWVAAISRRRAADFVQTVANAKPDIVLEFGFPFVYLPDVHQLKAAGAQHWWFEANHQTARKAFVARNEESIREHKPNQFVPLEAFENYVRDIAAHQDEIQKLFAPKIIETLQPGGTRLDVDEIHRQVLAGSTWAG